VRILHAPSAPGVKGTARIRAAVEQLKMRGMSLELIEISGVTNERVQAELDRCDFVVDQMYSDTPMATFAAEAACRARPAVVAGYYSREVAQDLRPEDIPPSRYCHPDKLEEAIAELASNAALRAELGRRAYEFVSLHFRPEKVARMYLRLFAGELPPDCFYDPVQRLRVVVPVGTDEQSSRLRMRSMLETSGAEAFQVRHNPALEAQMVRFASGEEP
jgi:hypothetical protein